MTLPAAVRSPRDLAVVVEEPPAGPAVGRGGQADGGGGALLGGARARVAGEVGGDTDAARS